MKESGFTDVAITRDMVIDKIDTEYEAVNQDAPNESDPDLLTYRLEVMTYLRDALYALPIPDELAATVYGRESILKEVYLFWMDEVARGDEVVDKVSLACACAKSWLTDVRAEQRKTLLDERIEAELAAYVESLMHKLPEVIINNAWQIVCFHDIQLAIQDEDLPARSVEALLTLDTPLYSIYDEFLSKDLSDHMAALVDAALDLAQVRGNSLLAGNIQGTSQHKQDIENYLSLYGELEEADEHTAADIEPEP